MKKVKIYNWSNVPVVLDLKTTALILGVNVNTVKQWLYTGELKGFKIGKKWFFNKDYLMSICQ